MKRIRKTEALQQLEAIIEHGQELLESDQDKEVGKAAIAEASIVKGYVEEMRGFSRPIFVWEDGKKNPIVRQDDDMLDRDELLDKINQEARTAASKKDGYAMGALTFITERVKALAYKEEGSLEPVLIDAVRIAAKVMQAAGLCRYENPIKRCGQGYPPTPETCERCIEAWLLTKACAGTKPAWEFTNGDAIRAMTDDELGAWLYRIISGQVTENWPKFCENRTECQQALEFGSVDDIKEEDCAACMTRWLGEVSDDGRV